MVLYSSGQNEGNTVISLELQVRFHEKWEVDDTGCWIWTAAKAGRGYGIIKIPGSREYYYAHRLSYQIHYGVDPGEKLVLHTCDNPACVKPTHLFLGTHSDNAQDMKSKDRHLRGARNKMAKLTDEKVRHLRKLHEMGVSQNELGRVYGVSQGVVYKIVHGQTWTHAEAQIDWLDPSEIK